MFYGNQTKTSETNDSNLANNRKFGSTCSKLKLVLKKLLAINHLACSSVSIKPPLYNDEHVQRRPRIFEIEYCMQNKYSQVSFFQGKVF